MKSMLLICHLMAHNWVHVLNTQIDIYAKTRDLNTGVGLVNKDVFVYVNM